MIAVIGSIVPLTVALFAFFAHSWIVLAVAIAIFLIYVVWSTRRVHHFVCVACGHDARDHHRLGSETAEVRDCIPRRREDRPCGCRITDDSPLRPVSLYAHVEDLVERHGGGGGAF